MSVRRGARGPRRDATRRVASRRPVSSHPVPSRSVVSPRRGRTDGGIAGNYVARTERPRNRNSCPRPPSRHPSGASGSWCPPSCPSAHLRTSVSHLSPPYPASTADRSPPRVHASGRSTITLPEEHRWDTRKRAPPTPLILAMTVVACTCTGCFETSNVFFNYTNIFSFASLGTNF